MKQLGLAGGVMGQGDEQAFAPGGHAGVLGGPQCDLGDEVGDLVEGEPLGQWIGSGAV